MTHLFVRVNVSDYEQFREGFDGGIDGKENRRKAGSKGAQIFRDADDPNAISILFEWENMEKLQSFLAFLKTPEMQQYFNEAALTGPPEAIYVFSESAETPA